MFFVPFQPFKQRQAAMKQQQQQQQKKKKDPLLAVLRDEPKVMIP